MLKEIANAWRRGGLMKDVLEELSRMIEDAEYVYTHAWEVCSGQAVPDKTEEPLRARDKEVNRGERKIRRMLVEHLTINPGQDVSGCLAVMVMAKDAERIGDLAKDIFKLAVRADGDSQSLKFYDRLNAIQQEIGKNFPRLKRTIQESSDELAHEILDGYNDLKAKCKQVQDDVANAELSAKEAAITALMAHDLTRINAHIANVASGVIFPLENIDFVSRGLREEKK